MMLLRRFVFWGLLLSTLQLSAQTSPSPASLREDLTALSALHDSIQLRYQEKEFLYTELDAIKDPSRKEAKMLELRKLNQELTELEDRFQTLATQADASLFEERPKEKFDWQAELGNIAKPIIAEFKNATKDSRELAELNEQLDTSKARRAESMKALEGLAPLLAAAEVDPSLRGQLTQLHSLWSDRLRDAENQIKVVTTQLERREAEQQSLLETTKGAATGFVQTRGLNLLIGVVTFLAVFFSMRAVQWLIHKIRPVKKKGKSFSTRLTALLWSLFTLLAAIGAMLAAFNATGDWFLLSLSVVFLIGIGWAGMKTLPAFMELFRMMLNMGAVREDERLIYEGLPWKVHAISFRTELVNPELDGGRIELPTRMLVGKISRPPGDAEEWFPSRQGDWVVLEDGLYGRISYQTPSMVQITATGGAQTLIPTSQYLERSPTVLSTGFRRKICFGIDYTHQAEVLSRIPGKMQKAVESLLRQHLGEHLQHVRVQFSEAADSSLNFAVWVDCDGAAAAQWEQVSLWTQQALVEVCNQEGWTIPFPQLQVHTS